MIILREVTTIMLACQLNSAERARTVLTALSAGGAN